MSVYLIGDDMQANENGTLRLQGNAQVRRIDSVVKGDRIDYDQNTGQVHVRGNGLIMRDGSIAHSPDFEYNLDAETGRMSMPEFWLGASGGSGTAERADILSSNHMRLSKMVYSGCPCPEPAWYIKSPKVDLYSKENEGVARNGVLYFKGVPLLYSPYLTFPLRKERKSGFLLPTYGMSTRSGMDISVPYYLNLAPNYDATLTPRVMLKRGAMLGGEFRYLGNGFSGELTGNYLPHDRDLGFKRWLFMGQYRQRLPLSMYLNADIRRVSDDDYFRDFSSFGLNDSTIQDLASTVSLGWGGSKYLRVNLSATRYQTLQDATSNYRSPQYDKLPELYVGASRYNWGSLDVVSDNYATRFRRPFYSGNLRQFDTYRDRRLSPDGTRFSSYTTVAYPIVRPGWYITPKAGLHMSQYSTDWYPGELPWYANRSKTQSRVLPILSLDSGMTFERDTTLFGSQSIQTLEPRVYYLYVPYRDQSTLPLFDTGLASFNFAQAFSENIYSGGWDRISNANQVTLGLTSRWLDADTGFERLVLQAAQRLYFEDQKVTLGEKPRTSTRSDYLVGASAALTNTLSVNFDAQFNPEESRRNRMSSGLRWRPKRLATLGVTYRYERDPRQVLDPTFQPDPLDMRGKESISLTGQWPLTNKFYAVGRYDYSMQERRGTQSILGLEYKGDCCWTARVVMQRYVVSAKETNKALFFQLELSGLGGIGNDPMRLLRDRVIGYEPVSEPVPEKTIYERYE
ncbi:MAG TPA: LPS-assembly protein LptD [Alcaligenes sp.]|nr:LPS-assembly protein LptD [Alcaligenes sp.]